MLWKRPSVPVRLIFPKSVWLCRHTISEPIPILLIWKKNGQTVWTAQSAQAFAQMASGGTQRDEDDPLHDPAGPWDYGDQYYPDHVLRYYHLDNNS